MSGIQILTYISLIVACIAIIRKVYKYATAPEHMRWELYPVPHEKGRADYGGSYLEESDWWTKKRQSDTFNELKEMAEEILLLKGIYHNNRALWYFSFPFHFGLYLSIGWLGLLLIGAGMQVAGAEVSAVAGTFGKLLYTVTSPLGLISFILIGFGAAGLFFWRLASIDQKKFSAPADYFNLLFFMGLITVGIIAYFTVDSSHTILRSYVASLITFSPFSASAGIITAEIVLISLIIAYIPVTKMSHFVAKYFLYHAVRWNDEPNEKGSKIEKRIIELLGKKVGWSAPHIQTGKTWGEVIQEIKDE